MFPQELTTPADRTKMRGVLVVESSTTCCISRTGGSTNLIPKLLIMNDVAQNDTLSGRRERTINIFCSSLHALSHSPGKMILACILTWGYIYTQLHNLEPAVFQSKSFESYWICEIDYFNRFNLLISKLSAL